MVQEESLKAIGSGEIGFWEVPNGGHTGPSDGVVIESDVTSGSGFFR